MYIGAFDAGSGTFKFNAYVYCANNPVNYSDPNGEFILTALVIGAVAGAVIGGTVGGTVAYNAAKSSGSEGTDLLLATALGVGRGAVVGGVAGGLIGATGGIVATYGAGSIAGTAAISGTATITAVTTEVASLQVKKSVNDGKNNWQIANDCFTSVFSNGCKAASSAFTKAASTTGLYLLEDISKHKVVSLAANDFLGRGGGKALPYILVGCAWYNTAVSICSSDAVSRANERGYTLV